MDQTQTRTLKMPQRVVAVVAHDEGRGIGLKGALPAWRLPSDMRRFRALTLGQACVMGRSTFESLGRPLPHRRNLVISRQALPPLAASQGAEWYGSLEAALAACGERALIIGGGEVYRLAGPWLTHLEITLVHGRFGADTWMPGLDDLGPGPGWVLTRQRSVQEAGDSHPTTWLTYVRAGHPEAADPEAADPEAADPDAARRP